MSLPSKTPVSLLQELCVRKGITPKYDLVQIEGAVHDPTFRYKVTVAEFSGEAYCTIVIITCLSV